MTRFRMIFADQSGATSVEYAAIASLISVVAIGAFVAVGTGVVSLFETIPGF